jgi:hypothetical protein
MGAVAQLAVTLILLRALYFLRRGGETPKGFVPIAIVLLFGSVTRVARLLFSWLLLKPSCWLDVTTSALLFITLKRRTVTQNSSQGNNSVRRWHSITGSWIWMQNRSHLKEKICESE